MRESSSASQEKRAAIRDSALSAALDAYQRQLATLDERIHALQEIRQRIMNYLDASDVPNLMFRGLKRLEVEWDEDFI